MRTTLATLSILALLIGATAASAGPVSATRGQPGHEVPMAFNFTSLQTGMDGLFELPGAERCPPSAAWFSTFEGQGVATHLGTYSERNSHCAYVDEASADVWIGHFDSGLSTITVANGDRLYYAYAGTFVVSFVELTSVVEEDWTVTGGTGRFVGATGSGSGHLDQTLVDDSLIGRFVGSIAYDASARADR